VDCGAAHRKVESRRHHADHCAGVPVNGDSAAHHASVRIEPADPQAIAENHPVGLAGLIFFRQNVSAKHGRDPKQWKQIGCHSQSLESVGIYRNAILDLAGSPVKRLRRGGQRARSSDYLLAVVPRNPVSDRLLPEARKIGADLDEFVGPPGWQRIDQNGLDRGKNYRRRTHGESDSTIPTRCMARAAWPSIPAAIS